MSALLARLEQAFILQTDITDQSHLPLWLAKPFDNIARAAGSPSDQIRFVVCLLSAIPLAYLHRQVPTTTLRHLYSLLVGVFFIYFVTGPSGVIHPFIQASVAYALLKVLPRTLAPRAVFFFAMGYMSVCHIYRMYVDYLGWRLDFTTSLMMVTIKLCMFAYNYSDGLALSAGEKLSDFDKTNTFRAQRAIKQLPSLLEYFSYVYFFAGVLGGPCFEIKGYLDFTDRTLFKKHGFDGPPRGSSSESLKCIFYAIVCYVFVFLSGSYFPTMGYINTAEFQQNTSFWFRIGYLYCALNLFRYKYYFAWYLAEAGCIASGLGFNGVDKDQKLLWDRCNNARVLNVELGTNLPGITNNWNKCANNWLKHYVYFRVERPTFLKGVIAESVFKNQMTKLTSALWHGFYPAYYLFFVSVGIQNAVDAGIRKRSKPYLYNVEVKNGKEVLTPKNQVVYYAYCVAAYVGTFICMNYFGASFALLDARYTYDMWRSCYFAGHVVCIVALVLLNVTAPKKRKASAKPSTDVADDSTTRTKSRSTSRPRKSKKAD